MYKRLLCLLLWTKRVLYVFVFRPMFSLIQNFDTSLREKLMKKLTQTTITVVLNFEY